MHVWSAIYLFTTFANECANMASTRCLIPLLTGIEPNSSGKRFSFTFEMEKELIECLDEVLSGCGGWDQFFDSEQFENVCTEDSCTTSDKVTDDNLHSYSVMKCLEEIKDYYTACVVKTAISTLELYGVGDEEMEEKVCYGLIYGTTCLEKMVEKRCGVTGRDLVQKKIKEYVFSEDERKTCDTILDKILD